MIEQLRGQLIVSCQAYPGEPLRSPQTMTAMALAAARGGAAGIRAQGLADIKMIKEQLALPLIGLVKVAGNDVFITPTLEDGLAIADAGAEIVALDGTRRPRPDGRTLAETIRALHEEKGVLVMADAGSFDDGIAAEDAGADIVGTTLAGYTGERPATEGPDLDLLRRLAPTIHAPLIAEGRIRTPNDAKAAIDAGAFAIVVGTAITHPTSITSWFVDALTR